MHCVSVVSEFHIQSNELLSKPKISQIGDEDCGLLLIMAATTQFGTLNEFRPDNESIKNYLERVQLYFTANGVDAGKQVAILLSSIGSITYSLLSDLLAPDAPKDKTLAEITAVLRSHYEPKRAIIAERFHFHKRDQALGESIADYDAALRKLATNCSFEAYLEDALRDRFVCGLRNEAMQRRLLGEADLTLTKAMELAQGMEAAERNARSFKGTEPAIRKIRGKPFQRPKPSLSCSRCEKSNHTPQECRFKDAECHACGKKGHIAPACRSKPQGFHRKQPQFGGRNQFKARQGTHQVHTDETVADSDASSNEFCLFKLQEPTSHPISIQVGSTTRNCSWK